MTKSYRRADAMDIYYQGIMQLGWFSMMQALEAMPVLYSGMGGSNVTDTEVWCNENWKYWISYPNLDML